MKTKNNKIEFFRSLIILLFLIFYTVASAQTQEWEWEWAQKSPRYQVNHQAMTTDNQGNLYITGSFTGTLTVGNTTLSSAGENDIFIVKYNANGAILWAIRARGNRDDVTSGITTDNQGNIYISGTYKSSFLIFDEQNRVVLFNPNPSKEVPFIAKYNSSGSIVWARQGQLSGGSYDYIYNATISADDNGFVYMAGTFKSEYLRFGNHTLNGDTYYHDHHYHHYVVKYSPSGDSEWIRGSSKVWIGYPRNVHVSTDYQNNIYLTGRFLGSISFNQETVASNGTTHDDLFLVKYTPNGGVSWMVRAGGQRSETVTKPTIDLNGDVYLSGEFSNRMTFDNSPVQLDVSGQTDVFLAKFSGSSGVLLWARNGESNTNSSELKGGTAVDPEGNVYLYGTFTGPFIKFNELTIPSTDIFSSAYDIFLAKFTSDGNILDIESYGGRYNDWAVNIAHDNFGNAYLLGKYEESITFGNFTLGNTNPFSFIAKMNSSWISPPDICETDLTLTETIPSETIIVHNADNSITASNIVENGASATYQTGYEIVFNQGFEALPGSDFYAYVGEGCPAPLVRINTEANVEENDINSPINNRSSNFTSIFPNPFTQSTTIEYDVFKDDTPVEITIYNLMGQQVDTLIKNVYAAGKHQVQFDKGRLAAGLYTCKITMGSHTEIKKMVIR